MDSKKKTWWIVLLVVVILGGLYFSRDKLGLDKSLNSMGNQPQATSEEKPKSTKMAPDFTIKLTDGKTEKLSDLKGKVVVLNFWSVDCPPCLAEIKNLEAVYKKDNKDVMFVGIATDRATAEETAKVLANNGGSYPLMVDEGNSTFGLYGIRATPTTVVINPQGEVVTGHTGYASAEQIEELIAKARG